MASNRSKSEDARHETRGAANPEEAEETKNGARGTGEQENANAGWADDREVVTEQQKEA